MKRRIYCLRSVLLVLLATNVSALGATSMTPEEAQAYVRQAYAKLTFAVDVGTIHTNAIPGTLVQPEVLSAALDANALRIELCDFRTIAIQSASDVRFDDILTEPDGKDILQISPKVYTRVVEPTATNPRIEVADNSATAQWVAGDTVLAKWNVSVAEAARGFGNADWWKTIVSYTVTVNFQDKTRDYNAFFLFGVDSQGNLQILPVDTVLQGSALSHFQTASTYPATLLRTEYRSDPSVMAWLTANKRYDVNCPESEPCCDTALLKCGVSSADLELELSKEPATAQAANLPQPIPHSICQARSLSPESRETCNEGCTSYSGPVSYPPQNDGNTTEHVSGSHRLYDQGSGYCRYSQGGGRGQDGQYPCVSTATANYSTVYYDTGQLLHSNYCHEVSYNTMTQYASGPQPTAYADSAMAVEACYIWCVCPSVSISYKGISAQFNPSSPFWKAEHAIANTCPYLEAGDPSPIVIDLNGDRDIKNGFTSVKDGVLFDFYGSGSPIRVSWTAANSNIGFLVLDRNGNGKIDNAKELFGNVTDQPPSSNPNGYLALAVFDQPSNGGNGNGRIDPGDAIWAKLGVWVDTVHTGDSSQGELYSLDDLGILWIGLNYVEESTVDQYGNKLRYKGTIRREKAQGAVLFSHDVFFRQQAR